jgi:hypothetical protein
MERFEITLQGNGTGMMTNRMTPEELELLRDKSKKKAKSASAPPAQKVAEQKVYYDAKKRACVPKENLMACLIEAGKFIRLDGKRQLSTKDTTIVPGLLSIDGVSFPLLKPGKGEADKWGLAEWRYDMRQGRNPNGGEAVCIVRPRWDEWAINFTSTMYTEELSESAFRQLFDYAGMRVGLGDFRPARKGFFGQFCVTQWKKLTADDERKAA